MQNRLTPFFAPLAWIQYLPTFYAAQLWQGTHVSRCDHKIIDTKMASVLGRPSYHFSSKVILRALAALTAASVFVNLLRSYTFTSSVTTKAKEATTVNYANAKATANRHGVQVMPSATTAHCVNHANKDSFS